MSEFSIPMKLVAWIMKHIDVDLREFRLKHKVIVFDKQLVCNILGVPREKSLLSLFPPLINMKPSRRFTSLLWMDSKGSGPSAWRC
jgi:hypothetical protein